MPARIELRSSTIAEQAEVEESSDSVFIALKRPPPVRSRLVVHDGEGAARVLEVAHVIEATRDDSARQGCSGRWVEEAADLAVGSEHLAGPGAPNEPAAAPVQADPEEDAADASEEPADDSDGEEDPQDDAADARPRGKRRKGRNRG